MGNLLRSKLADEIKKTIESDLAQNHPEEEIQIKETLDNFIDF